MKILLLLIGECFRTKYTHNSPYKQQIEACNSHILFIKKIEEKYKVNFSVYIGSYHTCHDNELYKIYDQYLIGKSMYSNLIGLNNLFHCSLKNIDINDYDLITYIRIDLFLKDHFINIFDPFIDKILFPTICWIDRGGHKTGGHPRINDMMLFIPKKYFKYINHIIIDHDCWKHVMYHTNLTYNDLDTLIKTYHDSNSNWDWNPLYYIVNRIETNNNFSEGHVFNKYDKNEWNIKE